MFSTQRFSNDFYFQTVSLSGRVEGFRRCGSYQGASVELNAPNGPHTAGDEAVICFFDNNGDVCVGTPSVMRGSEWDWLEELQSPTLRFHLNNLTDRSRAAHSAAQAIYHSRVTRGGRSEGRRWLLESYVPSRLSELGKSAVSIGLMDEWALMRLIEDIEVYSDGEDFGVSVPNALLSAIMELTKDKGLGDLGEAASDICGTNVYFYSVGTGSARRVSTLSIVHDNTDTDSGEWWSEGVDPPMLPVLRDLRATFSDRLWQIRWLEAWRQSGFHIDLARLGVFWAETKAPPVGAMAVMLEITDPSYFVLGDIVLRNHILDWMSVQDPHYSQWPKILYRLINSASEIVLPKMAFDYLSGILSDRPIGHNDWVRVWRLLWEHCPPDRKRIVDLAFAAGPRFARRSRFSKGVVAVILRESEYSADFYEEARRWADTGGVKTRGWQSLYFALEAYRHDFTLTDKMFGWMSSGSGSNRRWSDNWLRLYRANEQTDRLKELALARFGKHGATDPSSEEVMRITGLSRKYE
jgi:hypothetical protein